MNHNVFDVLELSLRSHSIFSFAASQATKDISGLLISSCFCQPAGALREEPTDAKQDQQRNDLESNGKPPTYGRVTRIDEAQPKLKPVSDHYTEDVQCELDRNELPCQTRSPGQYDRLIDPHVRDFRSLTSGCVVGRLSCPDRYNGVLVPQSVHMQVALDAIERIHTSTPVPQPLINLAKIIQIWF